MRKSGLFACLVVIGLLGLSACSGSGSTTRFRVHTQYLVGTQPFDEPNVVTDGFCADCVLWGYTGPLKWFYPQGYTDSHGWRTFEDVYLPANWYLARFQSARCPTPITDKTVYAAQDTIVPLFCVQQPYWNSDPHSINVSSPPTTITFSGDPVLSSSYGMPKIDIYNENGNAIGTATAASVASDGSSVTIATPGFLTSQYTGHYITVINNIGSDGYPSAAAGAAIDIYGNDPPQPPPPTCEDTCNPECPNFDAWACCPDPSATACCQRFSCIYP